MGRLGSLIQYVESFKITGIYLLNKSSLGWSTAVPADDVGYFIYTTMLAYYFGLEAESASLVFFNLLLYVPLIVFGFCFLYIAQSWTMLSLSFLFLARLLMPLWGLNHTYIPYFSVFMWIPLFFLFKKKNISFNGLSFLMGLFWGFADTVRSFSSLPVFVFFLVYGFFTVSLTWKKKSLLLFLICCGYVFPHYYIQSCIKTRNVFLLKHNKILPENNKHVFWHNIYTGLGYLQNTEGIAWDDSSGAIRALEIDPKAKYPSKLYEKTIRNEIFRLCKEKRYFIVTTIFAKLGVVLYYFLIYFGWMGLLLSYYYPKPWYLELSFWAALVVSALPGILTIPVTAYLVGFITCTILYTVFSCYFIKGQDVFK